MKRIHLLLIVLVLLVIYVGWWFISPRQELPMLVVNKTVPDENYGEHHAIFWLAHHWRFTDGGGDFMRYDQDYLGYHPNADRRDQLTVKEIEDINLLYLADSYGVYDYGEDVGDAEEYEELLTDEIRDVDLIYGGFAESEVKAIKEFAGISGHILVGEHNILGYPTYLQEEAAAKLEEILGVSYTGWLARYYYELNEAPYWLKQLYTRIHGQEWDLQGEGMVLVREEYLDRDWYEDLIIIKGEDMTEEWPRIISKDHTMFQEAAEKVPYLNWMEVVEPHGDTQVLANYEIPVDETNRERLADRGIPAKIPAVTYREPPGKAARIYFSGGFANQQPPILPASLTGSASIQRTLTYFPAVPTEYQFFFRWYAPVMKYIMGEVAE